MELRICKKIENGREVYIVQKKTWFSWSTFTDFVVDIGGGVSEYDLTFSTEKEAEEYAYEIKNEGKTEVVKYIE